MEHVVGPWGWDVGEEDGEGGWDVGEEDGESEAGGLTCEGREGGIAVFGEGGWEVRWEGEGGWEGEGLRVSLERRWVDGVDGGE